MSTRFGVGIDIGSTCAKTIVVDTGGAIVWRDLRPTGWSSVDTARAIRRDLPEAVAKDARFVATGYGRVGRYTIGAAQA